MGRFLFFIIAVVLVGCQSSKRPFKPSGDDNISQVVVAIIDDERSFVKKNVPLSVDLRKITVANLPLDSAQHIGAIPIKWVLNTDHAESFDKKDSSYILSQNYKVKNNKLNKNLFPDFKLTNAAEQKRLKAPRFFYEISIPIFSSDYKKAYVEVDKYCDMCGQGYTFYLEKRDGEWEIVWWDMRWVG
jgi:hypothetical protein